MDAIMAAIGLVFRTMPALIALVLMTLYGIGYVVVLVLLAVAWVVVAIPFSFVGAAMGGSKTGTSPSQRFKTGLADDVKAWRRNMRDAFGIHPDLVRWWLTGSSKKRD